MAGCYLLDPSIIDAWLITTVSAKHNSQARSVQSKKAETGGTLPGGLNTYEADIEVMFGSSSNHVYEYV